MPNVNIHDLMHQARLQTGLADFGPDMFIDPLTILVQSINDEAKLSEKGMAAQTARLINALSNRLRKQHLLRAHPEIHDEIVEVAAVITSLPRTGSTFLQRLLGASPYLTATRWWETIFPLPLLGEARHENHLRLQYAEALNRQISEAAGIASMHPMDPLAHDEDLMLIEQSFVSTMAEAMMYVPTYGAYVLRADDRWVWLELIDYLKILQWQSPARAGRKWILKSPNHMQHAPTILSLFPRAVVIMTHRDIVQVMGSWFSLAESLRCADSDADQKADNVAHWMHRWHTGLAVARAARALSPHRFVDVAYTELVAAPLPAAAAIHQAIGVTFDTAAHDALQTWLRDHPRDARPSHRYQLSDYGLHADAVKQFFRDASTNLTH